MGEFDDLLTFVRVVETGGLGRAADRLGVSKSVVSRRLDRLERDLNVRLLQRSTRGIQPTEAGLAFEARCSRLLSDLEEARNEVSGQDGRLSGSLRLAAPVSFGWRHLAPALAAFAAAHERLSLDVSYADRRVDLIGEGFDAAVRIGVPADSRLVARRLAPIRLVLVASPDYLAQQGMPTEPADLSGHVALIATQTNVEDTLWRFKVGARWLSAHPAKTRMRADNGEALMEAAAAGLGLTILPTFIATDAIRTGRLVPLLRSFPLTEAALFVLRPPGPVSAKVRALIDDLAVRFGPEPRWDECYRAEAAETDARQDRALTAAPP